MTASRLKRLNFTRLAPIFLLAVSDAGPAAAQQVSALGKAAETITAADVSRHIHVIADDSMMGRNTPSPGLEKTAQYVAERFKQMGLEPAGDSGTWFQRYPISGETSATAPNTVGILEGTDPKLKDEYIVFSAHMDHLGMRSGAVDSIFNGADDDASGTAGILELAEAFSQPGARPRRSLIFVTVSGEEKGLWGSHYFASHSPVPLGQVVANVNFDMIGRWPTDTMLVVGLEHSDLGATFARVNAEHPEVLVIPVPNPPAIRMRSSDHYAFASRGVPIIKFGGPGSNKDYHRRSDSPDKIEFEREARLLQFAFYLGQEVANADARPQWNTESYNIFTKNVPD